MQLKPAPQPKELTAADVRWHCNPTIFDFEDTTTLAPSYDIIGQERAIEAIKTGIGIKAPGYNIYISGLAGTGKATTVQKLIQNFSEVCPVLYDYAYVNNFTDPDRPILLTFPAGKAREFKRDIASFISFLRERIPTLLESEGYQNKRKAIYAKFKEEERKLISLFEKKLAKDGFSLAEVQEGETVKPQIVPIIDKKPVPFHQFAEYIAEGKLTEAKAQKIVEKYQAHHEELVSVFKKGMKMNTEMQSQIDCIEQEEVAALVEGAGKLLHEQYTEEKIANYLLQMKKDILENLQAFKGQHDEALTKEGLTIDYFHDYEINIILDNSSTKTAPVVVETSPTGANLFGAIEKVSDGNGNWYADFTKIKAGSLLKANGGYIVLRAVHLFEEPGVWKVLKRILTYRKLEIQDSPVGFGYAQSMLKPEGIEINAKIILLGSNYFYYLLSGYEDDFKKIFKIKADFDSEIKRSADIVQQYARVIKKLIDEEQLKEFDKSAVASLIELAARYAGDKLKLTTRFSFLADVAREANYWAGVSGDTIVTNKHIELAYNKSRNRHSLGEEKLTESILDNTILIETEGARVGCINGLAVYGNDYYAFGKPVRISATVALGAGSIINVEREAGLSGKIHDKGMLIITGFFREAFGKFFPLTFTSNIVFEQSYGQIDGDSASAAEVFALLSAITDVPIYQNIAVTGSVNQKGDIQPIGGVNEKIEGFFDICNARKLTKNQGVIIPMQNVNDLMLRPDIQEAVRKKQFHIYPIENIGEGIEILTGKKSGFMRIKNHYEKGTLFAQVELHLRIMYELAKNPLRERHGEKPTAHPKAKQSGKKPVKAKKTVKESSVQKVQKTKKSTRTNKG